VGLFSHGVKMIIHSLVITQEKIALIIQMGLSSKQLQKELKP